MSVIGQLEQWKQSGAISEAQFEAIAVLVRRERFSVFVELNALFYLGVVSIVAGVGWTIGAYAADLGDTAILLSLSAAVCWSLYYCFSRTPPFAREQVDAPTVAFDYVLYFGCLLLAIELGYLETRFHLFGGRWDHSLLLGAAVFFALAYRFDNRFVLSLALSSLGAWFGVRLSRVGMPFGSSLREYAFVYGTLVAVAGAACHQAGLKRHFLDAYLHVAINVLCVALLSGVTGGGDIAFAYLAGLLIVTAASVAGAIRFTRFAFVVYGVLYGYAGLSFHVLRNVKSLTTVLAYASVSGCAVVAVLVVVARRFGRES